MKYNILDDEQNFKAKHKTYSIEDVIAAGCTLKPMECKFCHSLEVEYMQYIGDALCGNCGKWQIEDDPNIMKKEDKNYILNIVEDAFYTMYDLEDIINDCDNLTDKEKDWAKENLSATIEITED